jgi:hypothetical protein
MLSTMSRCADYFRNLQNGRRCHGNGQNANKLKNTKMIIAGYLATAAILNFSTPPPKKKKLPSTMVDIPTKFHEL